MNFSEMQIEDMKLFVELKQGMLSHQERLLDVLFRGCPIFCVSDG